MKDGKTDSDVCTMEEVILSKDKTFSDVVEIEELNLIGSTVYGSDPVKRSIYDFYPNYVRHVDIPIPEVKKVKPIPRSPAVRPKPSTLSYFDRMYSVIPRPDITKTKTKEQLEAIRIAERDHQIMRAEWRESLSKKESIDFESSAVKKNRVDFEEKVQSRRNSTIPRKREIGEADSCDKMGATWSSPRDEPDVKRTNARHETHAKRKNPRHEPDVMDASPPDNPDVTVSPESTFNPDILLFVTDPHTVLRLNPSLFPSEGGSWSASSLLPYDGRKRSEKRTRFSTHPQHFLSSQRFLKAVRKPCSGSISLLKSIWSRQPQRIIMLKGSNWLMGLGESCSIMKTIS
ncbi:DNA replication and repair protein RecF [Folsomia candida]|uniref:DNA replication and repair protein RecF n=1 Tax=Folsomia candida TaxID=158441 RepID=A0A226DAZ5_FOLCA|nr:DNA replication and repair protein RecF [Folsomia candida]